MMAFDLCIIVVSICGLWGGAVWLVESAARIAKRLGMSELVIGLTVVAFGTSAPEFAVTVGAALKGQANISVGNVVGSNIFNLGFILGGVALVRAISTNRMLVLRDGGMLIGTAFLLLIFLRDLTMARWEGIVLLAILAAYIGLLIHQRQPLEDEIPAGRMRWFDVPRLVIGIAVVVVCGHYLVESASSVARAWGISEWVIGVTIVAAGTSTPELATSLVAVLRGRHGISAGNLIGSDLFNLLGVLGLAAGLRPMTVDSSGYGSLVLLLGMVVLVVVMMRTGWRITRAEGTVLVLINLGRWITDFGAHRWFHERISHVFEGRAWLWVVTAGVLVVLPILFWYVRRRRAGKGTGELSAALNYGWKAARRVVIFVIGGTVLLIGCVLIFTPGPALVVMPLGLAILATEFIWAKRLLRKVRSKAKELYSGGTSGGPAEMNKDPSRPCESKSSAQTAPASDAATHTGHKTAPTND